MGHPISRARQPHSSQETFHGQARQQDRSHQRYRRGNRRALSSYLKGATLLVTGSSERSVGVAESALSGVEVLLVISSPVRTVAHDL
jgi:hypothetical protein